MDFNRVLAVVVICVPVFAVIGLGKVLGRRGILDDDRCAFLNWLVYYVALPALIFGEIAGREFSSFADPGPLLIPMVAILPVAGVYAVIAGVQKYRDGFAAVFVFGTFWANTAYVGFPLARNAFGERGLALAAVYNIVAIPVFLSLGNFLIAAYGGLGGTGAQRRIRRAALNPIVISAALGLAVSLAAELWRTSEGTLVLPHWALSTLTLIDSTLKLTGSMGLPVALLAIGASLQPTQLRGHAGAAALTVAAKLVLLPLVTLFLLRALYPHAEKLVKGVAVLMAAMPCSVSSYVIARQFGVREQLLPFVLVVSTAVSALTIPVWLYIIL